MYNKQEYSMSLNEKLDNLKCLNFSIIVFICIIYLVLVIYDNMCMLLFLYVINLPETYCNTTDIFHYYTHGYLNLINT